jgi:energy-converting hydrogenase Eha subunit B
MVRQLLEQTHGRIPHLIIDPEGDFASLREAFDYLLVGRGGELAADVATAGVLAKRLFQLQANAIVDLSDLKPKPQQDYVAAFVAALMDIHQHEGTRRSSSSTSSRASPDGRAAGNRVTMRCGISRCAAESAASVSRPSPSA